MAIITKYVTNRPWTEEERKRFHAEIEAARSHPIVFDEDCPELTEEELNQFRRVNPRQQA